jgi:hypothetical protein
VTLSLKVVSRLSYCRRSWVNVSRPCVFDSCIREEMREGLAVGCDEGEPNAMDASGAVGGCGFVFLRLLKRVDFLFFLEEGCDSDGKLDGSTRAGDELSKEKRGQLMVGLLSGRFCLKF